jgi:hypothetical protein
MLSKIPTVSEAVVQFDQFDFVASSQGQLVFPASIKII